MSEIIINNDVDISNVKDWVFDVDDTLYKYESGIDAQIRANIIHYLAGYFDVDDEEAQKIQDNLYEKYGTTIRGLMIEYDMEPKDFMEQVHNLDYSVIEPNPDLRTLIKKLTGRKFTFSNGPRAHMIRVLNRLGIADIFDGFMATEDAYFIPKPEIQTFNKLIDLYEINPKQTLIFEDSLRNLQYPFGIGFKTFWIRYGSSKHKNVMGIPDYCDFVTDDIITGLSALENMLK